MPAGSLSDETGKFSDKKCKLCSKFTSNNDVKCMGHNCDASIHKKCFDSLSRVIVYESNQFKCRDCFALVDDVFRAGESPTSVHVDILKKEIECLHREKEIMVKYIAELEYTNKSLKANFTCSNAQTLTEGRSNLPAADNTHFKNYASAVKSTKESSVLFVRSTNHNIENKTLETEILPWLGLI